MTMYEVTVHPRDLGDGTRGTTRVFKVDTSDDREALQWGSTCEKIADVAAQEYCDSGNVVVRRIGGGERVVRARS